MSETTNTVVKSASAELGRPHKDRYELHLQNHDLLKEVLPIVQTKLLESLGDPAVNDEILREVARRKLITQAEYERLMSKRYVAESCHSSVFNPGSISPTEFFRPNSEYPASHHDFKRSRRPLLSESSCSSNECSKKNRNISKRTLVILALSLIPLVTLVTMLAAGLLTTANPNELVPFYPSCFAESQSGGETQTLKSLDEYNDFIKKYGNGSSPVTIDIHIKDPSNWPIGVFLETPSTLVDVLISGRMHINKIVALLTSIPNINKLTLSNRCNMLCAESQTVAAMRKREQVNLVIHTLVLKDFGKLCDRFLVKLEANISLGIPKDNSMKPESKTYSHSEYLTTLPMNAVQRLEIHNTTIETKTWLNSHFPRVNSIVYNSESSLPHQFCEMFPNLHHLSFSDKLISSASLNYIFDCVNLKSLTVHIKLPASQTEYSVQFLHTSFPKLESANIKIVFSECATTIDKMLGYKENTILGINVLPEILLVNLRISSNCKLTYR